MEIAWLPLSSSPLGTMGSVVQHTRRPTLEMESPWGLSPKTNRAGGVELVEISLATTLLSSSSPLGMMGLVVQHSKQIDTPLGRKGVSIYCFKEEQGKGFKWLKDHQANPSDSLDQDYRDHPPLWLGSMGLGVQTQLGRGVIKNLRLS